MRSLLVFALLWVTACGAPPVRPVTTAPANTAAGSGPNGLSVFTLPGAEQQVTVLHLRLPAGSLHETPDAVGAAHAAARWALGDGRRGLAEAIDRLGGSARAWTSREATVFEIVIAQDALKEALEALAAALQNQAVDNTAWTALRAQLDAEQHRARLNDTRRALEASVADLFDGHPFARAPLPDSVALRALKSTRIDAFMGRRYRPGGAVLVVAGGVPANTETLIADALATWKGKAAHVQRPPATPPGDLAVRVIGTRAQAATIGFAFLAGTETPEAVANLDVLAANVRNRVTAALRRVQIETRPTVIVAAPTGAGFVSVIAEVPGSKVDAAWRALVQGAIVEAGSPLSDARFRALKAQVSGVAEALDATPEGKARRMAAGRARWTEDADEWARGLAMISPDDLARLERETLRLDRATAVILAPDAIRTDDDEPWLRALVEQATRLARPDDGLAPGRHTLAEGVEAVVHPMPGTQQVGVAVWVGGGADRVRPTQAGLAALVARGMGRPVPGEPHIEVRAEPTGILLRCAVSEADLDLALSAIAQRVRGLRWTPARIEDARVPDGAGPLEALLDRAAGIDVEGTAETRARLTPAQVDRWYAAHVREAPITIVLAGAVDRRALVGLAERLGPRRPAQAIKPTQPKPATLARPTDGALGQLARRWPIDASSQAAVSLVFAMLMAPDSATRVALDSLDARVEVQVEPTQATIWMTAPAAQFKKAEAMLTTGLDQLRTLAIDTDVLAQTQQRQAGAVRVRLRHPMLRAQWVLSQHRAGQQFVGPDALDAWVATLKAVPAKAVARSAREDLVRARLIAAELTPTPARRRK